MTPSGFARTAGLFAALSVVVGSSCDVSYTDCAIACAVDGACPNGRRCNNGFCSSGPACGTAGGTGSPSGGGGETGTGTGASSGSGGDDGRGGTPPSGRGGSEPKGGEGGDGTSRGGTSAGTTTAGGASPGGASSGDGSPGGAGESAGAGTGGGGGSDPWTPRELPDLSLWLDAEVGVETTAPSQHTRVRVWRDQSGNENDAAQSDPLVQPRFFSAAANGRPSLGFVRPISYMTIGDSETLRAGSEDFTLEIVAAWVNATVPTENYWGYALLFAKQDGNAPFSGVGVYVNHGYTYESRLWLVSHPAVDAVSAVDGLNDGTFRLCSVRRVGTTDVSPGEIEIRINGSPSARHALPTHIDLGGQGQSAVLGGQNAQTFQALNGFIAEIVYVTGNVSDQDLERLERYLNEKYALWSP